MTTSLLVAVAPADGDVFGPISLVSQGVLAGASVAQQAEYAHDSAISGNGRYVVFDGSVGGVTGVWRRALDGDALEQVAGGDAQMPSISENGQYVSFTTNEGANLAAITHDQPDLAPKAEAVNVYVRNMAVAPAPSAAEEVARSPHERAFIVVSAPSGSAQPLTYGARSSETRSGSSAAGRTAISADGNEVAFVTTAVSNLVSYPQLELEEELAGKPPQPHTPALQVAVRNLTTEQTALVSRCYFDCGEAEAGASEPVVGAPGAVYAGKVEFPNLPASGEWPGASISADGSAVAWMGQDVGEQAPTLSAEHLEPEYTEPLWRRIAPGSATTTERVTGGSDPANPQCVASGETALPNTPSAADPCQGPFAVELKAGQRTGIWPQVGGSIGNFIPRLSANGEVVAFVAGAKLLAEGGDFGRNDEGQESDLYLASMPGVTRDAALTQITEVGPLGLANSAPIDEFEISRDGEQVAFTTARTVFPLGRPAFVSAPEAQPGIPELFDADLADGTLTRITHGFQSEAEPGEQPHDAYPQEEDPYGGRAYGFGALSPSFAEDGTLAFTSTADNLVFGDGNTPPLGEFTARENGSDAFVVSPEEFPRLSTVQSVSSAPAVGTEPAWTLGATAVSEADGSVLLYISAPGAGTLRVAAAGTVLVRTKVRGRGRHGSLRTRARRAPATRTVASAGAVAQAPGGELVVVPVRLRKPYAPLAAQRGGLSAALSVSLTAPRKPALGTTIAVVFQRTAHSGAKVAKRLAHGVRRTRISRGTRRARKRGGAR